MSLISDPSLLLGTSGNALSNTVLNNFPNSPSSITFTLDVTNGLGTVLQLWGIGGGTVNATNGLLYQAFSTSDGTWYDTNSYYTPLQIPMIVSTVVRQSFFLSTGKYLIQLNNMDPSNAINVMATTGLFV